MSTIVRTLLRGLQLGESPRWRDGRLWLSDWGTGQILAVGPDGDREVVATVEGFPFSIDWLPDGRLVVVSGPEGCLLRQEADGTLVTHADLTGLNEHAWNEVVVDGRGVAYVNNIGFDFPGGEFTTGIVVVVAPDGLVRQVTGGVAFPNGMAITPDNATLILAESYGKKLTAFDIAPDGILSNRRLWAEVNGHPDGICLDAEGAVWYGDVPNKRCVRVREGGEVLQTVDLDRGCFACMLGGGDGRTLFMTANEWRGPDNMNRNEPTGQVLTIDAPAPHAGWP